MFSMTAKNARALWRAFCGLLILLSLIHLSISRSKSPEPFPHYQNPRHLIARRCRVPGVAALTFDDFPSARIDELLGVLAEWNATATFFVNGPYDASEPMLQEANLAPRLQKIHAAGHQIASHTYDHVSLQTADAATLMDTMTRLDRWLSQHLGIPPPRFARAPYGECDGACARALRLAGYEVVGWGLDTEDWKYDTPQTAHLSVGRVREGVGAVEARGRRRGGAADIVLMHPFHDATVSTVAPAALEAFARAGFRLVSVAECLGYGREMWYR